MRAPMESNMMARKSSRSRVEGPRPTTADFLRRFTFAGALVVVGASLATVSGCMKKRDGNMADGGMTRAEMAAKIERALKRENPEQPPHEVRLLEGRMSGTIESLKNPRPECKHDEDGDLTCTFISEMGKDEDGDDCSIVCIASTYTTAFGSHVKAMVGESLTEAPTLEAKVYEHGLSSLFEANYIGETETKIVFGTAKVASLYAGGYGVTCIDSAPGGRETFRRVVEKFFESLEIDPEPKHAAVAAAGYQLRAGDKPVGFRYNLVRERSDGDGYVETNTEFRVKTDGETWQYFDHRLWVVRDEVGKVEEMKSFHWVDGNGPAELSAKPGENDRFRLKFRNGPVSNGLESTPKAPLNTEFWVAPELRRVSAGGLNRYIYSGVSLEDSDPTFFYVALTRSAPGVLLESASVKYPDKDSKKDEPEIKDEIHVNEDGVVTKEVTPEMVSELMHAWGQLPSAKSLKGREK